MRHIFRNTVLFFLGGLGISSAFAKRDITTRSVEQMDSWQEKFDINEKKPGKYNIVVTATDKGGNTGLAGPFNIYIDPESDLPVSGITNPSEQMRVPGNLNIVGTCVDDDGVDQVWLILDGDKENPVLADGKEFWSYYLDTTQLEEGPHTIEVYGTDINVGDEKKTGHSTKVTWNLDRRQPVTEVTNHTLGELVSGKVTLNGTVFDGNGIDSLAYSLDGGEEFIPTKLKYDKKLNVWTFEIPIDTRKFLDGPSVVWFKAFDKMGSSSVYSYLYFIDNTKPNVQIVSPEQGEVCNGIFGVAGFAKDVIGISKLSWRCGDDSGDFELVPGNPYWFKEIDTRGISSKSIEFFVTAVDTVGNTVTVSRAIPLDQNLDKPVVTIETPEAGAAVGSEAGSEYLSGLVLDDDGVASVTYRIDDGEERTVDSHGSFYVHLSDEFIPAGKHTVFVYATDIHGVKGNAASVEFVAKGNAPSFSTDVPYGKKIHPEDNPSFTAKIHADGGIASARWRISGGQNAESEGELNVPPEPNVKNDIDVTIPLADAPWGIVQVEIFATDKYGRTSRFSSVVDMIDLTRIHTDSPRVVFDDSRVIPSPDGSSFSIIKNDKNHPVHGFFLDSSSAGKIKSVALVPNTSLASAEFDAETGIITLKAGKGGLVSEPVVVRVTTERNKTFDSIPVVFEAEVDWDAPALSFDSDGKTFDIANPAAPATESVSENPEAVSEPEPASAPAEIIVKGTVSSAQAIKKFGYRIYSAQSVLNGGFVVPNSQKDFSAMEFVDVEIDPLKTEKSVSFAIPYEKFCPGVSVVEIVADNGNRSFSPFFVNNVRHSPEIAANGKKAPAPAKPDVRWFESMDGGDIYHAVVYQGKDAIENMFGRHPRSEVVEAMHKFTASISYEGGKTPVESSFNVTGKSNAKVFIEKVGDFAFRNGMVVPMERGSAGIPVRVSIESDIPVKSVSFEISGDKVPGGAESAKGTAPVVLDESDGKKYVAEFVMADQPSRLTRISVTAETELDKTTYSGTVGIVREMPAARIRDDAKIFWIPDNAVFDEKNGRYVLTGSRAFEGFANLYAPVSVQVAGGVSGVSVVEESGEDGRSFAIAFEKDGVYKNVSVKAVDALGNEFTSPAITVLVDTEAPKIEIGSPVPQSWIRDSVKFSAKVSDDNEITLTEISTDEGDTWTSFKADGSESVISFANAPDGLRRIMVRATDVAGHVSVASVGVQKDTVPPEVRVIVPTPDDIVNGENLIAFIAKDSGFVMSSQFSLKKQTAPASGKKPAEFSDISVPVDVAPMIATHVGTLDKPIDQAMVFSFTDEAGNATKIGEWEFSVDEQSDLPVASIHLPEENAVLTRDFTISGIVTDDDGKSKIWWKIDDGEYKELPEYDNSFSIDIPLNTMTDNEHSVTVYAVDINGIKGDEVTRNFRISLEEPKGEVLTPPISDTVREWIKITGKATDENGISKVYVSLDNGNSYDEAIGNYSHEEKLCNWSYEFDTRVIQDGTHVVFIKIVDWYGIEGLYSSLINIDNTPPEINLEYPLDDSVSTGTLFFSGQTIDNIDLTDLFISVRSLEGKNVPAELSHKKLVPDRIITQVLEIGALSDGFYNVELTGKDAADNITRVSRNFRLDRSAPIAKVDLLYPLNGEAVQSVFNVYGTAVVTEPRKIVSLKLLSDNAEIGETELSESGYYKFTVTKEQMEAGQHSIRVVAVLDDDTKIDSNEQYLIYSDVGPWITIDNFTYGDFAIDRPYIKGSAGYTISEEEIAAAKEKGLSKRVEKERKDALEAKRIDKIELSLDNGKTFQTISEKKNWKYRVENEDIAEGYHFLLVRARMKNGEVAVTRCIVQVDSTKPTIRLISPGMGGRYNQELEFSGLAHDDVSLKHLELALRKGDKAAYEIPGFIQGLYMDGQFWGATLYSFGAGLSFYDDNVKVQFQFGQFTQAQRDIFSMTAQRYGGNVMGLKILANVYNMPFRYYFGPDWDWLSLNVSVGANFSHFSESGSGSDQILSALLFQLEFPKVTRDKKAKMFRTFSFYTEGQLWFIPSDVSSADIATLVPQISFGLRAYVF